ncbi:MAG: porin family protein [Anaeromyxobacteraceae bacterium]
MKPLAGALVALLVPIAAWAQPVSDVDGPDTYLQIHLGALIPQSSALDQLDPGVAFGGAFGARFSPMVSAELGVGYARMTGRTGDFRSTLIDLPISASLRLRLPFERGEISGLAGADIHSSRLSTESTLTSVSVSDRATSFGWHVGAGAGYQLSPTILVGVDVRRYFATAAYDGGDVDIGSLRVAATLDFHF